MNWCVTAPAAHVAVHQPAFDVISYPVSESVTGFISRIASRIWLHMIVTTVPSGAKAPSLAGVIEQIFLLSSLLPVSL